MEAPGEVHRLGVALGGGALVEGQGLGRVLRHAASGGQQVGVVVATPVEPGFHGLAEGPGGAGQVHLAAPTLFQAAAEHVVGHGVALGGGDAEPLPRQRRVALDAAPVQQQLAQQGLRGHHAFTGGGQHGAGGLARFAGQALLQGLAVEDVGAGQGEGHGRHGQGKGGE